MYTPTTGRFDTLDPFVGDIRNPQSLNKYSYTHNDPIQGIDPAGTFFTAVGAFVSKSVSTVVNNPRVAASLSVLDKASTLADAAEVVGHLAATGFVNPGLLAGLLVSVFPFGGVLGKSRILGSRLAGFADEMTVAAKRMIDSGVTGKDLSRVVGDLGAIGVAQKMGFNPTDFPIRYDGFDGVFKRGDELIIVDAKGGVSGALGQTAYGEQLSQEWIQRKLSRLKDVGLHDYAKLVEVAISEGKLKVMKVFTKVDAHGNVLDPVFDIKDYVEVGLRSF